MGSFTERGQIGVKSFRYGRDVELSFGQLILRYQNVKETFGYLSLGSSEIWASDRNQISIKTYKIFKSEGINEII